MSVVALVAGLRERGVRLHLDQGRLKVGAPKGVLTDELLVQIRGHRDAITALLQEARDSDRATIPARQVRSPCVLSHAQRRLWFIDQLEGANAVYSIPAALRLRGPLDVAALHAAIQDIVDRHETLRTTFRAVSGEPMQVIAEWQPIDLAIDDALEAELAERLAAFASEPFDLAVGPLLRVRLLRLAADEHVLLTNMHHIISDGWSINVMTAELAHFYRARVRKERGSLPPLPIQYGDFAQWQQEHPSLPRQLAYWREQLADLPPLLALPTDRPRPPVQGADGASHDFLLPTRLAEALRNLGQSRGATLFMTLLAAFKVVLARYASQEDIAIGTPIANRTRPELEGLIGFFVNTLVLRSQVAPEQSFEQLLDAVRSTALAAYEHQDLPFEQLVEAINPARSPSQTPLFQVMFALQNELPGEAESLAGLELSLVGDVSSFAKFDLQLHLQEASAGIGGRLVYRTDLFDAATIARLAGHYLTLLEAVVAAPQARLSALEMVPPEERARLREPYGERT
ncbi:condensation domain-containing protein, partial [Frateuria sp. GZRR35]|uniref:condensation domain-containing protein n=2 Tax=unclassified Frateuria TaxID=2648894 RepID=UPI003EDC68DC